MNYKDRIHLEKGRARRRVWVRALTFSALIGFFALSFLRRAGVFSSAEEVMAEFYWPEEPCAEEWILDPLILNERKVRALVLCAIEERANPRRFYLIEFLGKYQIRDGMGALERIVRDPTELIDTRLYALRKLGLMDRALAESLMSVIVPRNAYERIRREQLVGALPDQERPRTYWEAFWSHKS